MLPVIVKPVKAKSPTYQTELPLAVSNIEFCIKILSVPAPPPKCISCSPIAFPYAAYKNLELSIVRLCIPALFPV